MIASVVTVVGPLSTAGTVGLATPAGGALRIMLRVT